MKKIITILITLMPFWAVGQSDSLTIDDYYIDFAVPDLSALGMLGIENEEIVRPGNMKEFAAALANFVDRDGSLKPALAMEWSFMRTFTKKNPVNWQKPFQAKNLALTMATTNQDSLGMRLGLGLKWIPIDKGDPMGDPTFYNAISTLSKAWFENERQAKRRKFDDYVMNALGYADIQAINSEDLMLLSKILEVLDSRDSALKQYCSEIGSGNAADIDSVLQARLSNELTSEENSKLTRKGVMPEILDFYRSIVFDRCSGDAVTYDRFIADIIKTKKDEYRKAHWNALSWEVSLGWIGHSPTNTYNDFNNEKFSMFTGLSLPTFQSNTKWKGQLIGQIKYDMDLSGDSIDFSSFSIGAKHLFGNSDNRLSLELLYSDAQTEVLETSMSLPVRYLRYLAGVELKLTDGTWLELALGGQKFYEGETESNRILSNFGLKHSIRNERRYKHKY